MVDALKECWRVLRPNGRMIDIRPIVSSPPVEIVDAETVHLAGHIDDLASLPDDKAADRAITRIVADGFFTPLKVTSFEFASYWNAVDELVAYVEDRWVNTRLPVKTIEQARRLASEQDGRYRVRIRNTLHLALYARSEQEDVIYA